MKMAPAIKSVILFLLKFLFSTVFLDWLLVFFCPLTYRYYMYILYNFIGDFVMLSLSHEVDVVMNPQTPDNEKRELIMRIDQMSSSRSYAKFSVFSN